jgi:hypothetical protein
MFGLVRVPRYNSYWLIWSSAASLFCWALLLGVACHPRNDINYGEWLGKYKAAIQINESDTLDSAAVASIKEQAKVDAILGYLPIFGDRSTISIVAYDSLFCYVKVLFVPDESSMETAIAVDTSRGDCEVWVYVRATNEQRVRFPCVETR